MRPICLKSAKQGREKLPPFLFNLFARFWIEIWRLQSQKKMKTELWRKIRALSGALYNFLIIFNFSILQFQIKRPSANHLALPATHEKNNNNNNNNTNTSWALAAATSYPVTMKSLLLTTTDIFRNEVVAAVNFYGSPNRLEKGHEA